MHPAQKASRLIADSVAVLHNHIGMKGSECTAIAIPAVRCPSWKGHGLRTQNIVSVSLFPQINAKRR